HRGLSGPVILQSSSYWREGDQVVINLLPDMDVTSALKTAREAHPKQALRTWMAEQLPKRLASQIADEEGFDMTLADLSNAKIEIVADRLNRWTITPKGTEGYRTAEVTLGGVDVNQLSSKTMETKDVEGLYFIGESVDVTGWLGGFNFQWAWASGHAAGQFV
ncbi:MAG: NAD(P)/FAD-dependent oxidoreductase, partial [Sphingomonadales bacterium]|nr:NAD(P)/FAD-dependent oxidoreductase [Sphingomonadales bacterium]